MPSSSTEANLFAIFTDRLEQLGLRYAVTGSVAVILYGEPRLTHDVDVVLELGSDADAKALVEAFPLEEFYCAPIDVVRVEARRPLRGHFNIIHHQTGFKADVYLAGVDALNRKALDERRVVELEGARLHVAPPTYVIVRKLEYYREGGSTKHLDDIRGMLRVSGDDIDRVEIEAMVQRRRLETEWAEVLDASSEG